MVSRQTRILLPCGIGDVYWSLVKFRAFCKHHGIALPPKVAIITTTPEVQYAGSEFRSIEFLEMVPFLEIDDPPNQEAYPSRKLPIRRRLKETYNEMWLGTCTYKTNFLKYDYFLVYNGAITNGIFLEDIDNLECEWHFPMNVSNAQIQFQDDCRKKYGQYVVFLWSFCGGGYSDHHVKEFHPQKIIEATNYFIKKSGCTPVFVGSWWDVKHGNDYLRKIIAAVPGAVDLVGKTNIDQLFGVIKGSEMVVGCHCGPTIMSTVFGKKTIILWAKSYPLFSANSPLVIAPPETRETTYWPLYTQNLTADKFSNKMLDLLYQETIKCVCGEVRTEEYEQPCYVVNQKGELVGDKGKFGRCNVCGVVRQVDLPFLERVGYENYYKSYPPTMNQYEAKDWEHDFALANTRCDNYKISSDNPQRILDVGSGSGAFVHACRQRNQKAYGCEIAEYAYAKSDDFTYRQALNKVNFPVDYFDLVTCHDVLEHEMDPKHMIDEMFRITSQNGKCIIDFPNYFTEAGKHHWKADEHIWYFTVEQLESLLKASGFIIDKLQKPIESKLVFYCRKPPQVRPRILLPPGIGDSYWSIVKMQAFLERQGLSLPDVSVLYPRSRPHGGNNRSLPFLEMFPFIHPTGTLVIGKDKELKKIWREAYKTPSRTIFKNVAGFDYFLSYNGHLRVGESLEVVDSDLNCNWFPPMFISLEQQAYRDNARKQYGKYIIFYFVFQGTYKFWNEEFPPKKVIEFIDSFLKKTKMTPIFVGAVWDQEDKKLDFVKSKIPNCVDLVGKTTIEQLFGLIRGAEAVIGYPSGLTIMSTVLGTKTCIIWNDYYNQDFFKNSCPPSTYQRNYFFENTAKMTPKYLKCWALEKLFGIQCKIKRPSLPEETTTEFKPIMKSPFKPEKPLLVVCVLKSGYYFNEKYVVNLKRMVERNLTIPHDFVCLTDYPSINGCDIIPLENSKLNSWWSKLELFRKDLFHGIEKVIYFDLDTIILSNIDIFSTLEKPFYGLRPWNRANFMKGNMASGIMVWKPGNYGFLYEKSKKIVDHKYLNDQEYLSRVLKEYGFEYWFLQDEIPGIRSFKRECRQGLPINTRIVCFHGRPWIHEVLEPWVKQNWRP